MLVIYKKLILISGTTDSNAAFLAAELDKDVEAHLDQCNIPTEKETEMFCNYVEKYNYQGKSRAIHSVSLACQSLEYQKRIEY